MMHLQTNSEILHTIGKRVKDHRVRLRLTQKQLAFEADVSLKTLVNFEHGHNVSLLNFIAILRALKTIDQLNLIMPEPKINPLDYLTKNKLVKRVRYKRIGKTQTWQWGDES
jgi:transcriptional regulator with XRE-family HTH domain